MPFFRYCSATLARFSLKITTECHSVFSLLSPDFLSFQLSDVAMRRLTTGSPDSAAGFPDRPEIADQIDLVHATRHHTSPRLSETSVKFEGRTLSDRHSFRAPTGMKYAILSTSSLFPVRSISSRALVQALD